MISVSHNGKLITFNSNTEIMSLPVIPSIQVVISQGSSSSICQIDILIADLIQRDRKSFKGANSTNVFNRDRCFCRHPEWILRISIAEKRKFSSWRCQSFIPWYIHQWMTPALLAILSLSMEWNLKSTVAIWNVVIHLWQLRTWDRIVLIGEGLILQNTCMALISPDDWLIQTLGPYRLLLVFIR